MVIVLKHGNYVESENLWETFINDILTNNCDTIYVGSCSNYYMATGKKTVGYSNISAHVFRIYDRALSSDEVMQNYEKAFGYYNPAK